MKRDELESTAIALLTAAGLDDDAATFSAILDDVTPGDMRIIVVELVAVWRGTVRGLAIRHGENEDTILRLILNTMGAHAAAKS